MPPWSLILIALAVVMQFINPSEKDFSWYRTLKRPDWINMQPWIPIAWLVISVTFYFSTLAFWNTTMEWRWVAVYAALLVLLRGQHWLICRSRNLAAGLPYWVVAWVCTLILALIVRPTSPLAAWLLLPVLVWVPVEATINQQMIGLNRTESRRRRGPDDRRPARSRRL